MLYVNYISIKLEENFAYYNLTLTGTVFLFVLLLNENSLSESY